jgi:SAM-dependent methyltransferase
VKELLRGADRYYTGKFLEHGPSPKGVDWRDEESQLLRFEQVLKIVRSNDRYSINDLGCGYGKLFTFMTKKESGDFIYRGYDLSGAMVHYAEQLYRGTKNCSFIQISDPGELQMSDYTVSSGIFNVKQEQKDEVWREYILETIGAMDRASQKGFAFNCLTSYSDKELMRPDLYYADPCFLFDFCKREVSSDVALLHDYGLFEFTILVKKRAEKCPG